MLTKACLQNYPEESLTSLPSEAMARFGRGSVSATAVSPDGNTIAVATRIGVWIYNAHNDDFIKLIAVEGTGLLSQVTFSPNSTQIAIGDWDGIASVWDIATGEKLATFTQTRYVNSVAFSPDGKLLATGSSDHTAILWDIDTGSELWTINHKERVSSVAFSPDGLLLATGSLDSTANLWDVETGENRRCFTHPKEKVGITLDTGYVQTFNNRGINCIAFSPDGKYFATGDQVKSNIEGITTLWDIQSGEAVWDFTHEQTATSITFSIDNRYMATRFSEGDTDVRCISDGTSATFQEVKWGKDKIKLPPNHPIGLYGWLVSFSPDSKHLAAVEEGSSLKIWDIDSGTNIKTIEQDFLQAKDLTFSPEGLCAGVSRNINTTTFWKEQEQQIDFPHENIISAAVSPDTRFVATGGWDKKVYLWDRATQKLLNTLSGHTGPIIRLAFSSDGKHILSTGGQEWEFQEKDGVEYFYPLEDGNIDQTAKVWNIETGIEVATLTHSSEVESVAFSPESTYIATTIRKEVYLWDTKTWQKNMTLETVDVESLVFSPDASILAVGGTGRKPKIQIWNLEKAQLVVELSGHKSDVQDLAFSPDGMLLASGGFDGVIYLWDMTPYLGNM